MISNLKNVLETAYKSKYAIPAFNVDNYEMMKAIVDAGEKQKHPVILMFTRSAIKYYGLKNLISVANNLAENVEIPVITHLDHEENIQTCFDAIDCGISSVMYDGSHLPFEENIKNTNKLCEYIKEKKLNVSIEAELGQISGVEDWKKADEVIYTNINEAELFVKNTNIDCLAISIGTAHGIYKTKPVLNLDLLGEINEKIKFPLVLHGGSGLSEENLKNCIKKGICKINFGTEIKHTFASAAKVYLKNNPEMIDIRKMLDYSMSELSKLIETKIRICRGK